ncbi:MAG: phosphoribosylaminoimidazolesuccinocarboxamide synthase [Firmicutes bacterium]|nr:phosphoribosylaminoimidazolesuccinocarboxamide synthase [Bacillota bacterium]
MMTMELLYEGKAKKVFKTNNPEEYMIEYKDDATAFNGVKKSEIAGKGVLNNKISSVIFELLEKNGVETHYIKQVSEREMLVKKVEIVALEVIIRNTIAGSLSKRLGIEEGLKLEKPLLELCYKNDDLGDPFITEDHVEILDLVDTEGLDKIKSMALKVNEVLKGYFLDKGINLVDFKLEFGYSKDGIVLADEISPDTCRLWDVNTGEKLDKDRFRRDMGGLIEAYENVVGRL